MLPLPKTLCLLALSPLLAHCFTGNSVDEAPNKELLECFDYHFNYWLMGHAFHTTSIEFKNDCLRDCLTSELRGGEPCRSAMHIPDDKECVLAGEGKNTRPELFTENDHPGYISINYYENKCVDAPIKGGKARARLSGYKGGDGLVDFVQDLENNMAYMKTLLADLESESRYSIYYVSEQENAFLKNCDLKLEQVTRSNLRAIVEVKTDKAGMAIQAWKRVPLVNILGRDSMLNRTLLVVKSDTNEVIDCGVIERYGNASNFDGASYTATGSTSTMPLMMQVLIMTALPAILARVL